MLSWFLALALALPLCFLSAAYLWFSQRRKTEAANGVRALAGMRWLDFSHIVRRAMREQRGMQDLPVSPEDDRGPSTDFVMLRNGERWLLSCKHGQAYRPGSAAVNELGAALRLAGARGGILITEGEVKRDGLLAAEKQSIEVLDARHLWTFLKPYVPAQIEADVTGVARRDALRRIGISALASLTLGLLVGMGYLTSTVGTADSDVKTATAVIPARSPVLATAAEPAPGAAVVADPIPAAAQPEVVQDLDEATLREYQQAVSRALALTPGVTSGIWITQQTLAVDRTGDDAATWAQICKEVQRFPALRTVRIQLNPRPGSNEQVRWRQCSTV